ncbi:PEP-utilizing enzyme [Humidesulfovibrio idahonensis]
MADAQGSGIRQDGMEPGGVRFLFRTFKRILGLNTQVLERMAQMDRALGGEYVFDKAFLESSVRDVCRLTHLVAYHLNGMAGETHVALYDASLAVKDALEDILAGGMGPLAGRRVLPFAEIGWELEPLAGLCSVGLAVLGRKMGLPAPDGFAVTVTGMHDFSQGQAEESGPGTPPSTPGTHGDTHDGAHDGAQNSQAARDTGDETLRAVETLFARLGGPRRLEISFVAAGAAGAGRMLGEAHAETAEATVQALARFGREHADAGPVAACVRPHQSGVARGTLQTLAHDPSLPPAMLVVAEPPETGFGGRPGGLHSPPADSSSGALVNVSPGSSSAALSDRYWLARTAPHMPLRTRVAEKPLDAQLPGGQALDPSHGRMLRGSAWLLPEQAALLAQLGLAAERALDGPCLISWVLTEEGGLLLTGLEPAEAAFPDWPEDVCDTASACPGEEDLLLHGGQIACSGVGAGPVLFLDDDTLPESVPLGSVGVARAAVPALSRIVPRLGALLTEVGTAASHLATVTRENRVPAVFGLKGAASLATGAMVTVDAEQAAVYRGVAEGLLRQAAMQRERMSAEPEFLVLRRLLRHIRPLNLVDPTAENFRPENCRTCHDIIHFAHERAVELLVSIDPTRRGGLGAPRRLREDSPFELRVVDVGGGLKESSGRKGEAAGDDVALADIASLPLRAFLDGLLLREARREGPARMALGDIFSGMGRTGQALSAPAGGTGLNLALAGRDYANITLRLGYHFSVVDAVVADKPEQTFVYFRFAGGFASGDRRARRAGLILRVLERLGFRASRKGDLVVGKRKMLEQTEAFTTLRLLGALSAYTRQLDVELADDADVERFAAGFLHAAGLTGLWSTQDLADLPAMEQRAEPHAQGAPHPVALDREGTDHTPRQATGQTSNQTTSQVSARSTQGQGTPDQNAPDQNTQGQKEGGA